MFTGIIEGFGAIAAIRSSGQGKRLSIEADFDLSHTKIGDSICVSGACLTAVKISGRRFEVDVSPETLEMTTFGQANVGERVNLERAMRFSDRIDGHLVSGHIDGTGSIRKRETLSNAIIVSIEVSETLTRYLIAKGSVAVDGTSLTINTYDADSFSVSIIPHTAQLTTIGFKNSGDRVNIETDMIGKYVERFMGTLASRREDNASVPSSIDHEFLLRTGFVD
ncbi:MAG: riboflavin synthase [Desulfobacterales bacterium]|nr:riboflavin synthase [Desulfobacterales bacterium]